MMLIINRGLRKSGGGETHETVLGDWPAAYACVYVYKYVGIYIYIYMYRERDV